MLDCHFQNQSVAKNSTFNNKEQSVQLRQLANSMVHRIMGTALRLAHPCLDNGLVKHWLKIFDETWICKLSPLNN